MKIKKFIATILTVITALGFTLGLAGCKKVEYPELTAEKPVYDYYFWKDKTTYQFKFPIGNGLDFEYYPSLTDYDKFLEFYNGEYRTLSNEVHYILNPALTNNIPVPPTKSFQFLYDEPQEDGDNWTGVCLCEWVRAYQEGLDKRYDRKRLKRAGEEKWTAAFECIIPAVVEDYGNEYTLEFGESELDGYNYYINVYAKGVCIATVYSGARNDKKIPLSWFKEYFATNLYYGG